MDKDIRQRFQQSENDLLDSISRGSSSLMSFESSWDSLYLDYSRCASAGELSDDTISIAKMVASRIGIITNCFSDFHKTHEESRSQLLDDVESILNGLNRVTISPPILPTQNAQSLDSSLPPFIQIAYKWLLANIDNPYPSSDTKASIAKSSGCSLDSISSWFVSARRRIGWTTICRKHFNNCRADTVDAACRALVKEDPSRVLLHPVFHDFLQMKAAAHDLYASTFTKSALAGDLDAVVKDMTQEDRLRLEREKKEHAQEEKNRREEEKEMRRVQRALERQAQKTHAAFTYPSPTHSRSPSPVPTLEESWTGETEDEGDDFIPPVLAGRKRRASVSYESTDAGQSPCADRPMKRLRSSAQVPTPYAETLSLPSPPSSSDGLDANDGVEIVALPQPSLRSSRKRRLSDTDAHAVPKRPRGLFNGPRINAVSDPLPRASVPLEPGIDDWFQMNFFEIPGPVENVSFDQFAPLDIEVFNEYTFPDTQINSVQQPFQQNYTLPTLADLPLFDEHVANVEGSSHIPHSAPPGLDHLDNFLDALSAIAPDNSGEAVAPSTAFNTISQPSVDLVPSNCFSWTDFLNTDQPFLSDIDQFSLPSSCDDLSQLPEIDLSAIQLPPLLFTPQPEPPSSADCARLAKLEQLQHLREQTRLLEQDLAVSV